MRLHKSSWIVLFASVLNLVACKDPEFITVEVDTTPPASVTDLAITDPLTESVRLLWSATGDDGDRGLAVQYEIRFSRNPHVGDAWLDVDSVLRIEAPAETGTPVTVLVDRLVQGKSYYFAVRAADEVPNWSQWSNTVSSSTSNTPPVALFSLKPDSTCYEAVTVDASASYDAEDSADELCFRWDWQADGIWDTGWGTQRIVTLPTELPGPLVTLQVRDEGDLTNDAMHAFSRDSAVQIRSAARRVVAQYYQDCCVPRGDGGCDGCFVYDEASTAALGLWSVSVHNRTQHSYVGVDSIWASGRGGEGNTLRVLFDLCADTRIDVSQAGCHLGLTSITTGETILQVPDCLEEQHQLTVAPGSYDLSVHLHNSQRPFRLAFLRP